MNDDTFLLKEEMHRNECCVLITLVIFHLNEIGSKQISNCKKAHCIVLLSAQLPDEKKKVVYKLNISVSCNTTVW